MRGEGGAKEDCEDNHVFSQKSEILKQNDFTERSHFQRRKFAMSKNRIFPILRSPRDAAKTREMRETRTQTEVGLGRAARGVVTP